MNCLYVTLLQAVKKMLQIGSAERGLLGQDLVKMLDHAQTSLRHITRETTTPLGSHTFQMLCNTFVPLDILAVSLTGDETQQFSRVYEDDFAVDCPKDVANAFSALKDTTFTVCLPTENNVTASIRPWTIWACYKHRSVGDVTLKINDSGHEILSLGAVDVNVQDFRTYLTKARELVVLAAV